MTTTERSAQLARQWIEAWIRMDMDWLRQHLAPGFVHVSPFGRLEERDHYLTTVEPMARKSVMELVGVVGSCDWVRIEGDRLAEIRSFYDTAKVRQVLSSGDQEQLHGSS